MLFSGHVPIFPNCSINWLSKCLFLQVFAQCSETIPPFPPLTTTPRPPHCSINYLCYPPMVLCLKIIAFLLVDYRRFILWLLFSRTIFLEIIYSFNAFDRWKFQPDIYRQKCNRNSPSLGPCGNTAESACVRVCARVCVCVCVCVSLIWTCSSSIDYWIRVRCTCVTHDTLK